MLTVTAIRDKTGQIRYFFAVVKDITELRHTQAALRDNQEKFTKAFFSSPAFLLITDLETGTIIEANEAYASMTGYDREEVIGRSAPELGLLKTEDRADYRLVRLFPT